MRKKPVPKSVVIPVVILILAISVFVAFVQSKPKVGTIAVDERVWGVEVVDVEPQALAPQIILYGKVETPQRSQLTAAIEADVAQVLVKVGDTVKEQQTLINLDDQEHALLLKQRQAELSEINALIKSENARFKNDKQALEHEKQLLNIAQQEYQRALSLERNKLSTQSNIDETKQRVLKQQLALDTRQLAVSDHYSRIAQLKARKDKAEALTELAQLNIKRSKIVAPYAGKITAVKVAHGDRARVGSVLVEMYNHQALEVKAQIPTQVLEVIQTAITQGLALQAYTLFNGERVELKLERLSGEVSLGSGGQDSFFQLLSPAQHLPLGRTLELHVVLPPQADAIGVPRSAIYGNDRVYTYEGGRMVSHTVERLGEFQDHNQRRYVLIKNNELKAGDRIIITQLPNAIDGLRVDILGSSLPQTQ
ncbi:efflux RND transporter periplasmic adaptor subunit [Kaarinaea lacus]